MTLPAAELDRVSALRRLRILDTPREVTFDRVTGLLARLLGVPYAGIALVDADRIWYKAMVGMDCMEARREPGLCATTIQADGVRHVPDATLDPIARCHPLVTGERGVRFYVGTPLRTAAGARIGTLCAFGPQPRDLAADEQELVEHLGALVMHEILLRRERGTIDPSRPATVLVVDGDVMVRTLAARALHWIGYRCLHAAGRQQLTQLLCGHEGPIDACILDGSLPDAEFDAIVRDVRRVAPAVELVIAAPRIAAGEVDGVVAASAERRLYKPFGPDDLIRTVQQVVKH